MDDGKHIPPIGLSEEMITRAKKRNHLRSIDFERQENDRRVNQNFERVGSSQ